MPLATIADLKNRIGETKYKRYFDDDGDGVGDPIPAQSYVDDGIAKVKGELDGVFTFGSGSTFDVDEDSPPVNIRRITVDVIEAFVAKRHPEISNNSWMDLLEAANSDLRRIRPGKHRLGTGTPTPSESHGASVASSTTRGW